MELIDAAQTLSALAQENRLAVFRLLMREGRQGMAAGEIAQKLGTPPNTLSAQLTVLAQAGLVTRERHGRSIIYSANYDAMGALMRYLLEDCCEGRTEICAPLFNIVGGLDKC